MKIKPQIMQDREIFWQWAFYGVCETNSQPSD